MTQLQINKACCGLESSVRISRLVNVIIVSILAIITITPFLDRNFPPIILLGIDICCIVSMLFIGGPNLPVKFNKVLFWTAVWYSLQILYCIVGVSSQPISFFIARINIYIVPFLLVFLRVYYNNAEKKLLRNILLCVLAANIMHNVYLGITNPALFVGITQLEGLVARTTTNAGSTTFVFLCVIFAGMCLYCILCKEKYGLLIRWLAVPLILMSVYFVMVVQSRGTAFFMLVIVLVGMPIMVVGNKELARKRIVLLVAVVLLLYMFSDSLLSLVQQLVGPGYLYDRLNIVKSLLDNSYTLETGGSMSSFSRRTQLNLASLQTFISSPGNFFFGIGEDQYDRSFFNLLEVGVGNHSEFFDVLAEYGVLGGFILFNFIRSLIVFTTECCFDMKRKQAIKILFLVFVIYGFLNNVIYAHVLYVLFGINSLSINLEKNSG